MMIIVLVRIVFLIISRIFGSVVSSSGCIGGAVPRSGDIGGAVSRPGDIGRVVSRPWPLGRFLGRVGLRPSLVLGDRNDGSNLRKKVFLFAAK